MKIGTQVVRRAARSNLSRGKGCGERAQSGDPRRPSRRHDPAAVTARRGQSTGDEI